MFLRQKVCLVVIAGLQCVCLCFILMGVTGGFQTNGYDTEDFHISKEEEVKHKNVTNMGVVNSEIPEKVVLVVIDALRLDFMTEDNFPFLMGKLRKYQSTTTLKFDVKVDSPTVTLPRVKTLVTGKAPMYMDVLRNFQTADTLKSKTGMSQPNLISNLRKQLPEVNICFFGDETWLRLFPAENEKRSPYFKKWEGVTSFYVRDFYEVDSNVTRHLEDIDDCNFLILHYLGLDHIGHVYGPKQTSLLKRKLQEMDHVIQHLHSHLSHVKTKKSKNLILVTGDHGMANVGGHGGSSLEEVLTPLVSIVVGGIPQHHSQLDTAQIKQIDIAPTLASIWNVEIPRDSRGQLILDLVEHFKSTDQLAFSYQKNCKHLLRVLGKSRKAATYNLWWSEISKMETPLAIKKYIELEQELASTLQSAKTNNDLLCSFVVGVVILLCMQIYLFTITRKILGRHARLAVGAVFVPSLLIYFSSSFIEEEHYIRYYLYPTLLIVSIFFNPKQETDNYRTVLKILMFHRFAMLFNQTGDKWSSLPDLNDFIQEKDLQWLTAIAAVILVYLYSPKTVKRSRSFATALIGLYLMKIITHYVEETVRGNVHWIFVDSKLQKFTFLLIFFHLIHHFHQGNQRHAISSSSILFLLCLQKCQNLIITGLILAQVQLLQTLIKYPLDDLQRRDKAYKSSIKRNSIVSRLVLVWFAQAAFYYQGNSNGLATVDVTAGYIGVDSYSSNLLIGSLIFFNTYSSSVLTYIFTIKSNSSDSSPMLNGSAHVSNSSNDKVNGKSKEKTKKSTEWLPLLLLLSNGAESIVYSCSIMIFQNHLFIWSVFVPKLLYLIMQCVVCILACTFYVFVL